MAAAFGAKFIDRRDYLTTKTQNGRVVVAASERVDSVHLTTTAMAEMVTAIQNKLTAMAW